MQWVRRGLSAMLLGLLILATGCKEVVQAPTGLAYGSNPATYTTGTAIPANSPTSSGGSIGSYGVSPALPAGLSLNASTGVISGTPTLATAAAPYTVTGSNSAGSSIATLTITVIDPVVLAITTQPANQTVLAGQTATFTVVATGAGTLTYQWLLGGVAIPGATSASYTTPATVLADNGGSFTVQVADATTASITSTPAILTVSLAGPGTFSATGSLTNGRYSHTATRLNNGKVLIVGGYNGNSMSGAELYDPATGLFTATGPLTTARDHHTATLLADGKVLIAGGVNFVTTTATAEVYDPIAGTFTATTGNLQAARSDHSATLLPGGKVLIVSGRNGATTYVASAEIYDPSTGLFTTTTNAPLSPRATHSATLLGNGKVLIAGGFFQGNKLATAELYDPAVGTGTFATTGALAAARTYHTATLLASGKVLVVGGAATAVTELYDPSTGAFTASGSLVAARSQYHAATLLPNGTVLIVGGVGVGSPAPLLSAAELYDPGTGLCTATGSMAGIRELHTATTLLNGKVLIAGGAGNTAYLASAELYF